MVGSNEYFDAGTYAFTLNPNAAGTINGLTHQVAGGGTVTWTVNIAGSPVTGLAGITTSLSSETTTSASAANTFVSGPTQPITFVATVSNAPYGFAATLNVT